uniref:Uncharacterized protein n=1 Tax=Arundo donax TaxID=35708 RepID=A0A0A9BZX6_ARUDO
MFSMQHINPNTVINNFALLWLTQLPWSILGQIIWPRHTAHKFWIQRRT